MNKGKYSTISSDPIDVSSTLLIREPEVQALSKRISHSIREGVVCKRATSLSVARGL